MGEARIEPLFARPVYLRMLPLDEVENDAIVQAIEQYPELAAGASPDHWFSNVVSTFSARSQVLTDPPFANLVPHILESLKQFTEQLGWVDEGLEPAIFESWLNVYNGPVFQEVHQHPMSLISGVYFVAAPAGSGDLFFQAPEPSMFHAATGPGNKFPLGATSYTPVDGLLVLFPSELRHGVKPSAPETIRITMAFNVRQQEIHQQQVL